MENLQQWESLLEAELAKYSAACCKRKQQQFIKACECVRWMPEELEKYNAAWRAIYEKFQNDFVGADTFYRDNFYSIIPIKDYEAEKQKFFDERDRVSWVAEPWTANASGIEVKIVTDNEQVVGRYLIDGGKWNCVFNKLEDF